MTKQALMSELWPNTFVEEASLTFTVSALRKVLGDAQDGEQFLQTVPTRGYRFVAPVIRKEDQPVSSTPETPARSFKPLLRRIAISAVAVSVVAMLPVVVRHMRERTDTPAAVRFTIPLPPEFTPTDAARPLSQISPEGRERNFISTAGTRTCCPRSRPRWSGHVRCFREVTPHEGRPS